MPNIKKHKFNRQFSVVRLIVFVIFTVYAITLMFPIVWGFINSMLTRAEFNQMGVGVKLPSSFNLENYAKAWVELAANGIGLGEMLFNSIWYAGAGSVLLVLFSTMAAYVVAKYEFPGRKFVFTFNLGMMMIPVMGNMAASIRFYKTLGAFDNLLWPVLSAGALGTAFVIMNATFKGVSWQYAEAALIDGAGHFQIFWKVMVPQVVSPMVALMVSQFITLWNDSMTPLIYMPGMPTLASGLYVYQIVTSRALNYPMLFAALLMCLIPVIILFLIFQEKLMDIQLGGGLKG